VTDGAPSPLAWTPARIESVAPLSERIRSVVIRPRTWRAPVAGQHVVVRLTAPDGYTAQRSYSVMSAPCTPDVYELAIERLDDGEVSPWFHDAAQPGDEIEIRGPVGGHFVWEARDARPVLLIGGGSGVVPLIAMARHRMAADVRTPMRLLYAARSVDDVILLRELLAHEAREDGFGVRFALSRSSVAPRAVDHAGRLDTAVLRDALEALGESAPIIYLCGSHRFVEGITAMLGLMNLGGADVRTERFGG